eukprot:3732775-Amphidinium_carterae.1
MTTASARSSQDFSRIARAPTTERDRQRSILSACEDKSVGSKRLTSMPDRVTNTMTAYVGGKALRYSKHIRVVTHVELRRRDRCADHRSSIASPVAWAPSMSGGQNGWTSCSRSQSSHLQEP